MGLDVYLEYVPHADVKRIVAWNRFSRNNSLRSAYCCILGMNSIYITDWQNRIAKYVGLPQDTEAYVIEHCKEIEFPSTKYRNYSVGYIRSGSAGINDVLRFVIGHNLYYAFPEAKSGGGYIQPNWQRSLRRLKKIQTKFQAKGPEDARFNKAVGINQESGRNLIRWLKPTTSQGFKIAASVTKSLEAENQFQDYMEKLGAIIETVEYVLAQPDAQKYIFYWSP